MPFDISILSVKDIIDILLVAFLLYKTYKLMKSSGSINVFTGILVFIIIGLSYRKCCKCVCSVRYSISW